MLKNPPALRLPHLLVHPSAEHMGAFDGAGAGFGAGAGAGVGAGDGAGAGTIGATVGTGVIGDGAGCGGETAYCWYGLGG